MHPLRLQRMRGRIRHPPPNIHNSDNNDNNIDRANKNDTSDPAQSGPSSPSVQSPEPQPYTPSLGDVLQIRLLLRRLRLPPELSEVILDLASYHAHFTSNRSDHVVVRSADSDTNSSAVLYLSTKPLPYPPENRHLHVKSVTFRTRSRDQGFTSTGRRSTYEGSYSWFEASILRPKIDSYRKVVEDLVKARVSGSSLEFLSKPLFDEAGLQILGPGNRMAWELQRNVCASLQVKEHVVVWRPKEVGNGEEGQGKGEGFVECLMPGDRVAVWARALYPRWENLVDSVDVDVAYALT